MLDERRIKEALLRGLAAYDRAVADDRASDAMVQLLVTELDALVPHGGFSELFFWGERERSRAEIIDEAIRREKLWLEAGELALLIYKEAQMTSALGDPNLPAWARSYIEDELPVLSAKIASFAGPKPH